MAEAIHDWLVRQNRTIEKFGYKLINRKREELCQNCKRRRPEPIPSYHDCFLLPITSEGADCPYFPVKQLAGEEGFEPSLRDPESRVLPLDDSPVIDITELKSSPLSGLLNTIIPLNLPQKKAGTGLLLQSQLPSSPICDLSLARLLLNYHDIVLTLPLRLALYKVTVNANETISIAAPAPPTPCKITLSKHSTDETRPHTAPLTLPEYVTEVALC